MSVYSRLDLKNGTKLDETHFKHFEDGLVENEIKLNNFDMTIHSVNHRGYSTIAPENTIPAYILSKKMGFTYAECDVAFTQDGIAVLLHDSTIDRTSDGSGNIGKINYADLAQYDFGSWKSAEYAGTSIPTFSEFIILCKNIGLHPYIELKSSGSYTSAQIQQLVAEVAAAGMQGKVTWISFSSKYLKYVKEADETARLGFVVSSNATDELIAQTQELQTGKNEVFLDLKYSLVTNEGAQKCIDAKIPLEVWTVNSESALLKLHPYITGITSDSLVGGRVLYEKAMKWTPKK